jgi:hypothetical protein
MTRTYKGACFCGAVRLEATGSPKVMGNCHCSSCRSWSAGPVNAFSLWDPEHVKVTEGREFIGNVSKTPQSVCDRCKDRSRLTILGRSRA